MQNDELTELAKEVIGYSAYCGIGKSEAVRDVLGEKKEQEFTQARVELAVLHLQQQNTKNRTGRYA